MKKDLQDWDLVDQFLPKVTLSIDFEASMKLRLQPPNVRNQSGQFFMCYQAL